MRKTVIVACLLVAMAACGADEPAASTGPGPTSAPVDTGTDPYVPPAVPATTVAPATTATTTAPATTAAPEATGEASPTITIAGFAFSGPSTVSVGDTVEVVNNDGVTHTWTSTEDGVFNLSLAGGASGTYTFEEPGEYQFFCSIHPSMTGSITVEG